jgi:3-methylfumaryl-CoA hydratase
MAVITEEARRWAGQEHPSREFPVNRREIARYASAIGATDPIHFDPVAARELGYRDVVAPPLFFYVIRMQAYSTLGRDGLTEDGSPAADVPPLPTQRAMAGETRVELGAPVVAGDVITVEKRLRHFYEKEGRSGPLVFVEMEYLFTDQAGEVVAREVFTRIYR